MIQDEHVFRAAKLQSGPLGFLSVTCNQVERELVQRSLPANDFCATMRRSLAMATVSEDSATGNHAVTLSSSDPETTSGECVRHLLCRRIVVFVRS